MDIEGDGMGVGGGGEGGSGSAEQEGCFNSLNFLPTTPRCILLEISNVSSSSSTSCSRISAPPMALEMTALA